MPIAHFSTRAPLFKNDLHLIHDREFSPTGKKKKLTLIDSENIPLMAFLWAMIRFGKPRNRSRSAVNQNIRKFMVRYRRAKIKLRRRKLIRIYIYQPHEKSEVPNYYCLAEYKKIMHAGESYSQTISY